MKERFRLRSQQAVTRHDSDQHRKQRGAALDD
jgi:hypothetical protein